MIFARPGGYEGRRRTNVKTKDLKVGLRVWCWWASRYLWFAGKAYNAKDYEFVDADDTLFLMNSEQVEKLEIK